jgi:hypothetical protein
MKREGERSSYYPMGNMCCGHLTRDKGLPPFNTHSRNPITEMAGVDTA